MQKDSLVIGRGGSAAWVDVQVVTTAKVSREHVRIRRDSAGRFLVQDVSLWGTSVNGEALPPAVKTAEGVLQPGAERELPPRIAHRAGRRRRDPVRGSAMTGLLYWLGWIFLFALMAATACLAALARIADHD